MCVLCSDSLVQCLLFAGNYAEGLQRWIDHIITCPQMHSFLGRNNYTVKSWDVEYDSCPKESHLCHLPKLKDHLFFVNPLHSHGLKPLLKP